MREALRLRHYSLRTEQAYIHWTKRYIDFHGKRHPRELGPKEVEDFLSALAVQGRVSASTQGQALAALLFLYKQVLGVDLPWLDEVVRAKRPQRLPTMLTPAEVARVLDGMEGTHALMARLLYGTGMRLMECLRMFPKLPPPARFPDNALPEPLLRRVIQPHEQTPGNRTSGRRGRAQAGGSPVRRFA